MARKWCRMRSLFSVVLVLLVCVVAIGFYMRWFTVSSPKRDGNDGKINVQLSMDTDKVKADATEAKDKATELARPD